MMSLESVAGSHPEPIYSDEANALFAAMTVQPTIDRKKLIDEVIIALQTAGIWTKLDCLYLFAAHDEQAAKLNLINPGTFTCTTTGPIFNTDNGFLGFGDGTSAWVRSTFNPSTAGGNYAQNDATVFAYTGQQPVVPGGLIGYETGSTCHILFYTGDLCILSVNDTTSNVNVAGVTDGRGFWAVTRRTSTEVEAYKNGASVGTDTDTSTVLPNTELVFLRAATDFHIGPVMAGGFGGALSDAEHTALYDAIHPYLVAVAGIP